MSSELLEWVYNYLERADEIVVPVKKMWNEWQAAHEGPPLGEFTAQIFADERIEPMGGVEHTKDMEGLPPEELAEYEREMEEGGYFSGPRVKLKSREITLEHIARMIQKHNDRMEEALQQAREALPDEMSEQEEAQLIEIQALARKFRQSLREAGLEPDEPDEPAAAS